MYNSFFNGFFKAYEYLYGYYGLASIIFIIVGILGCLFLCARFVTFSKIVNVITSIFGIWWSIGLLNAKNWYNADESQISLFVLTALFFSITVAMFFAPLAWSEETAETTYYLVLGTLFAETETSGGIKTLSIYTAIILIVGTLLGTWWGSAMGAVAAGIIGIILYAGIFILNAISFVSFIKNEF